MKDRLFKRNFTLLVIVQIISILGSAILRFAIDLYVLDITGRADIFALVVALSAVPGIIFSPIGGAIADRLNRRNLMVIFNFATSVTILLLLFLLKSEYVSVLVIGIFLTVLSVISSMYQPTVSASVPLLVSDEKLTSANGIVNGVGSLSFLIGPILGGVLYGFIGLDIVVSSSAAIIFLAAIMLLFLHIPFVKRERDRGIVPIIIGDMKIGAGYVTMENPKILRVLLLAAALNMLISPFFFIGTPYVLRIVMQSSEALYGAGMAVAPFASVLGALLVGTFSKRMKLSKLYISLTLCAVSILFMAFAVTPVMLNLGYWPSFLLYFLFGSVYVLIGTVISIFVITAIQKETPNELLGKVMALVMAISQCVAPLGQALYGFAFERFNTVVYIPFLLACIFTLAITIASKKMLRNL